MEVLRMKRKFYRGKLPTIVWNPAAGKPLAVFKENQFVTQNDKVAEILLNKGYHEVGMKDLRPPVLPDEPIREIGNIPIMSGGMSEKVELANIEAEIEDTAGADAVDPEVKKEDGTKRSITRRTK
jgi:hypothetical protein